MQLQAGYVIDVVRDLLQEKFGSEDNKQVNNLLECLSYFDVETTTKLDTHTRDSTYAVLSNIISRGLPTRMSMDLEKAFWDIFEGSLNDQSGTIFCEETTKLRNLVATIFDELHVIDPRLRLDSTNCTKGDSNFEKQFLFDCISSENNFLVQILEGQRNFEQLTQTTGFANQRVDFVLDEPHTKKGWVIEVDGDHHQNIAQINLDNRRDSAAKDAGWKVLRSNNLADLNRINAITTEPYFAKIKSNYKNKDFSERRLDALQIALSPYAIARLQKLF